MRTLKLEEVKASQTLGGAGEGGLFSKEKMNLDVGWTILRGFKTCPPPRRVGDTYSLVLI